MCGICGKLVFKNKLVERELIAKMCRTLVHRGPDDSGVYTAEHIGLGQQRLSIIDLSSNATAPLSNENKTIWVTFNGEIYNFQALREELLGKDHIFYTKTDTEVIVHLYEEYGVKCLDRMRGMFAFALWDSRKKQLFAARDRLGQKPFCYARTVGSLVFGSEIKAITADPEICVSPNFSAIDRYLTYAYVPSPVTAFKDIYKLPPAHYLTCSIDGKVQVQRYWRPPFPEKTKASEKEIKKDVIRLLRESVKLRMISDVPLGAFLSGGIDSAAIVALMAQESSQPVKTFSIGFKEDQFDELPYARLIADRYGTDHHEYIVEPKAAEVLPLLVRHYNEPFADSSALPTYYVSKITRQQVTVALSGDGGDESFAGYDRYNGLVNWRRFDVIPMPLRKLLAGSLKKVMDALPYHNTTARLIRGLVMLGARLPERYQLEMTAALKPQEKKNLYTRHFADLLKEQGEISDPIADHPYQIGSDTIDWMMNHDQNFYLPDDLMVKSDIASMANSLELRCPFLDHHLVAFAAAIPSSMKRSGVEGKLILKDALRDLLPEAILTKHKTGFGVPLEKWFKEDLNGLLRETLLCDRAMHRNMFDPQTVRKMIDEHVEGRRGWSNRLWALLFLEMWFREFID